MSNITYHSSHTFETNDGVKHSFITQLYKVGVYGILDNDPSMQGHFRPQDIKKMEKDLQKQLDIGKIKSFELGIPITVTDKSGLWEKVE